MNTSQKSVYFSKTALFKEKSEYFPHECIFSKKVDSGKKVDIFQVNVHFPKIWIFFI